MTLKIGDKVRFLNDVGGGIITAFIDEKMVEVQTDDGFEIPVLATELLLDATSEFGLGGGNQEQVQIEAPGKTEEKIVPLRAEEYRFKEFKGEALLAIAPENDKLLHVSDLMLYLINDSNYSIQFIVTQSEGGVDELVIHGELEANTKLRLKKYTQSNLSKIKALKLKGHFFKEGLMEYGNSVQNKADIEGISFYKAGSFSNNEYFEGKAIIFKTQEKDLKEAVEKLSDSDIIKVTHAKEEQKKPEKKQKPENPDIEEVDLHIESILDKHDGMSNGEIVEVQLGRFETALETALKSTTKKIVFIHGVGNGRLKLELRKKLDRKYSNLKYQDASFKEYGYGATMVYLK